MNEAIAEAFSQVVLNPQMWLIIFAAAIYGIFMGAVPGLTATMAVALLVPVTFFMSPIAAIAAIVTLERCAIFAGDIPGALIRIPGTPASAAYAEDAYALTRRGEAERGLAVCLTFSVLGGLIGAFLLILLSQPLANFATQFSVIEYFWLYLLGLGCAVTVSRGSPLLAALGLIIGLLLSTVGLSAVHTQARFTFGQPELYQGVNFIPAMIGLFGLSEVLRNVISIGTNPEAEARIQAGQAASEAAGRSAGARHGVWLQAMKSSLGRKWHTLRSGGIGSLIGMLPGAGADIAAWVSVAASKRWSKKPEEYGKGSVEALGDATTANSSALAGAWIPALVFGIPGDSVTAIVIGVLLMKNVTPGPEIFSKQAVLVYSIYLMFLIATLVMIPVGWAAIKAGTKLVRVPRRILLPVILFFCVLGSYAINGSYFDVGIMAALGVLGYLLERLNVPLGPVVLGIILGGPLEERFIQTWTASNGSLVAFVSRPVAAVLALITIALWLGPILFRRKRVPAPGSGEP